MPLKTVAAPSEPQSESYLWSIPGAPIRVHFQFKVIKEIEEYLKQGASTSSAGVVQSRGLLFGNVDVPGNSIITGFSPLAAARLPDIGESLSAARKVVPGKQMLGYFRTHTGSRLYLSNDDLALAETFFYDPACVLLLINQMKTGTINAGFFFWDRGQLNGDFCFLEFPFNVSALEARRHDDSSATDRSAPTFLRSPSQQVQSI
jgi:hypothetical protein